MGSTERPPRGHSRHAGALRGIKAEVARVDPFHVGQPLYVQLLAAAAVTTVTATAASAAAKATDKTTAKATDETAAKDTAAGAAASAAAGPHRASGEIERVLECDEHRCRAAADAADAGDDGAALLVHGHLRAKADGREEAAPWADEKATPAAQGA